MKLLERGTEWILVPKSELSALLAGKRRLPVKDALSDEHKAVLLVVIGHRRNAQFEVIAGRGHDEGDKTAAAWLAGIERL
jgi:hypothetical protein